MMKAMNKEEMMKVNGGYWQKLVEFVITWGAGNLLNYEIKRYANFVKNHPSFDRNNWTPEDVEEILELYPNS